MENDLMAEIKDVLKENSNSFSSLCRVCWKKTTEDSVSLFETRNQSSLCQKIMMCTRIQMRPKDCLPSVLCRQCCTELDIADNFRTKCERSETLLQKISDSLPEYTENKDEIKIKQEITHRFEGETTLIENFNIFLQSSDTVTVESIEEAKSDIQVKFEISDQESEASISFNTLALLDTSDHKLQKSTTNKNKSIKTFCCHICHKQLKQKSTLIKHISNIHSSDIPDGFLFKVSGYGAERKFHCPECDYKSPNKKYVNVHMRIHTGEKPFQCDVCECKFSQHASLNAHKKKHSDKMYFTCPECGKQFKHKRVYDTHIKGVHGNEKKFTCTICNKNLSTSVILKEHLNRHRNIKNFNCETCGAVFVSRSELCNHYMIHNSDRKFQCHICDYVTYRKRKLELHIIRHSGQRSFKCKLCDYSCYTNGGIRNHMLTHTKQKKYTCPECDQKFVHSSSVNKHMRRLHGKKFKWSDCVDRRLIK